MNRSIKLLVIAAVAVAAIALPTFVQADTAHDTVHIGDPSSTANAELDGQSFRVLPRASTPLHVGPGFIGSTSPIQVLGVPSAATRLGISTITLSNHGSSNNRVIIESFQPGSGSTCSGTGTGKGTVVDVRVPPLDTVQLTYPVVMVAPRVSPSAAWCLRARLGTAGTMNITITGAYLSA